MAQDVKAADRLKAEAMGLVGTLGDRALASVRDRVQGTASRLTGYVDEGAGPGLMAAVTGGKGKTKDGQPGDSQPGDSAAGDAKAGRGRGKGRNLKVTNIVETIDVGAPIQLVYAQWTQFAEFPSFMKKVENVEQAEEQTLNWKAQVLWSHRTWESTILEQSPEDKIIWRSKGAKGYVDGAVTFHELAPSLTRILLVLEYHPQGFFEHTANVWRAQGRRVRLELKHFRRHVMSEVLLHPDEVEGWRGVIRDGEVVPDDVDGDDMDGDDMDGAAGRARAREGARS
ncbi:MAG TPA: SRPBCC family protein [Streptosporangiaceae bacterium]|nr:SRPBCC family protein [Streptosporangiaceae bacterium]